MTDMPKIKTTAGRGGHSRGRTPSGKPNPVDIHVGARIRLRRTLLGMSQEKLGEALGLSFQQIQKYERGANRAGASRLFDLSRVLDVPVSFFFDDMEEGLDKHSPRHMANIPASEYADPKMKDPMQDPDVIAVVRAYSRIKDPTIKKSIRDLLEATGKN